MNLTVEESTTESISPILYHVLAKITPQSNSSDNLQKDIMFITIIVLMIENDFVLLSDNLETAVPVEAIELNQLLKRKSNSGLFEASFSLLEFKSVTLKLIMSPLGAMAVVNAVIKELDNDTYTVCLPISRYVVSPQATSIPLIFRDLRHLSIIFKNKIITPVKSKILNHFGYAGASLIGLPVELIFKIMLYLPIGDILDVSRTCKRLNNVLDNDVLWHNLCTRDFNKFSEFTHKNKWKTEYKTLYKTLIKKKDFRTARAMHDQLDQTDYVSNSIWNVLI